MPKGDYGAGAKLTQLHIEVDVDEHGGVAYVGIGYHVLVPSGKRHASGYSVELGDKPELKAQLRTIADEIAGLVREHEGVEA